MSTIELPEGWVVSDGLSHGSNDKGALETAIVAQKWYDGSNRVISASSDWELAIAVDSLEAEWASNLVGKQQALEAEIVALEASLALLKTQADDLASRQEWEQSLSAKIEETEAQVELLKNPPVSEPSPEPAAPNGDTGAIVSAVILTPAEQAALAEEASDEETDSADPAA